MNKLEKFQAMKVYGNNDEPLLGTQTQHLNTSNNLSLMKEREK